MNTSRILSFALILFFSSTVLSARNTKLELDPGTLSNINQLLENTSELHKALFDQNDSAVKKELTEMNLGINSVLTSIGDFQVQNHGMHLKRILQSTKNYLESYQNLNSSDKRLKNLKKAFSQLIQLVRIYRVDKKYRIFYCKADNSEWIQEGWKAKNPIHPSKHGRCGQRAYR